MNREDIIKSNYLHARINYIERFMFLWLPFNTWYNDVWFNSHSEKGREIDRVAFTVNDNDILEHYRVEMSKLNDITEPKLASLVKDIDNLSKRDCIDEYGNHHTSYIDTTSTKYKIIASQSNVHTTFLSTLNSLPNVTKEEGEGNIHALLKKIRIYSFEEVDGGTYFKNIYKTYSKEMDSEKGIAEKYDAVGHIRGLLYHHNIAQYGELLYKADGDMKDFPSQEDIENGFTLKHTLDDSYENSVKELLELELTLLYKFRCAIFHGDIDMNITGNPDMNNIAKSAYEALDNILYSLR